MRLRSSWTIHNRKGSMREQARRESNGSPHRETRRINAEIAGDNPSRYIKQDASVDKARINAAIKDSKIRQVHDIIRARFGPRLVRHDGSALYQFQCVSHK